MSGILFRLANNTDEKSYASNLRRKRFRLFLEQFLEIAGQKQAPVGILDVGGTPDFWKQHAGLLAETHQDYSVTVINLSEYDLSGFEHICFSHGDARSLPQYHDGVFDLVFSNSVIEHVGGWDDQIRMAHEVRRVGRRHFVQTPCRSFPIEPHYLFPLWAQLPVSARAFLHRRLTLGWMPKNTDRASARADVEAIRLLSKKEFRQLFPGSRIVEEKILGLTKSMIALG